MLKRSFIAFMIVNEVVDESTGEQWPVLKPHDHPVFTGEVAYDLLEEQEIQVCEEHNVREFVSPGEAIQAVNDYFREVTKEGDSKVIPVAPFVILEHFRMSTTTGQRSTKKSSTKKSK